MKNKVTSLVVNLFHISPEKHFSIQVVTTYTTLGYSSSKEKEKSL